MKSIGISWQTWLTILMSLAAADEGFSQRHSFFTAQSPPGEIGRIQIARRPELGSVFQPVLLKVPEGASVSIGEGTGFGVIDRDAALVSMQVGSTYRLKVSNIPNNYIDIYPTVELIDRMHAPPGKEIRYPIPIHITAEELEMAIAGKFVTRVIYVEDPRRAIGARELPDDQRYFEVMVHEDPFLVASRLGRPVAILRMGSLAPNPATGPDARFLFGSPPVQRHALRPKEVPYIPSPLSPEDVPAEPLKQDSTPEAPSAPDIAPEPPAIPSDLPEKRDLEEEPEEGMFDGEPAGDVPLDPVDDAELEDDPFGDAESGDDPFDDMGDESDDPFGDLSI